MTDFNSNEKNYCVDDVINSPYFLLILILNGNFKHLVIYILDLL